VDSISAADVAERTPCSWLLFSCGFIHIQLEEAHRAELAKRDAQIREKDAEISRLNARLNQFEHVAAMMSAVAQPAAAATSGSSKKRSRQDMPLGF
jgi:hypothetical protein